MKESHAEHHTVHTPQSHKLSDKFHVHHSEPAIDHRGDSQSVHLKDYHVFFKGAHPKMKHCFNLHRTHNLTPTETNPVGRNSQRPPRGNYCHLCDAAAKINTQKGAGRRDPSEWHHLWRMDKQGRRTRWEFWCMQHTWWADGQAAWYACIRLHVFTMWGGVFIRMQRRLWHHGQNKRQWSCIGIDKVGLNRGAGELMASVWAQQQELCCQQKCQVSTDNLMFYSI